MPISIDDITSQAMRLSPEVRTLLAKQMPESLDMSSIRKIYAAWMQVIRNRIRELETGQGQPIPGKTFLHDLRSLAQ